MHSLIISRLDYCNAFFLYWVLECRIKSLQRMKSIAARVVAMCSGCPNIKPMLKKLNWLSVEERIPFKVLLLLCKNLKTKLALEYLRSTCIAYNIYFNSRSNPLKLLDPGPKPIKKNLRRSQFYNSWCWEVEKPSSWFGKSTFVERFKKSLEIVYSISTF